MNAGGIPNGVMTVQRIHGLEKNLKIYYFGHFYLLSLLRDRLLAQPSPCRVVVVAAYIHRLGTFDLSDLHYERRKYTPFDASCQANKGKVMLAKELARQTDRIEAVSLHPGTVRTNYGSQSHLPWGTRLLFWCISWFCSSLARGTNTVLFACLDPGLATPALRGSYITGCAVAPCSKEAQDPALCQSLWEITEKQLAAALAAEAAAPAPGSG
jgi:NAD(P)-dependent dehydrogenase (short-subunit alcohol dehydrogenase family)